MKLRKKVLQELNLQVMQIIWDKGKATVHEIRNELALHRKLSYSTVATIVGRLEKQGYLTHEKMEHMHVYIPLVSKARRRRRRICADGGQTNSTSYYGQTNSMSSSGQADSRQSARLTTEQQSARQFTFHYILSILVWLWFALAIVMFLRLAVGLRKLWKLRLRSSPVKDAFAKEMQEKLCQQLGIRRHVDMRVSDELSSPISLGLFSPAIILPSCGVAEVPDLGKMLSATELNTILAHELTHIKRWDYLISLLQQVIGAVVFFHPLYYLASRQLNKEREYIADAWVIKLTKQPLCYARTLSHIAEVSLSQPSFLGGLATVTYRGEVSKRVAMILHPQRLLRVSLSKKTAFAVLCLASVLFAIASMITVISFARNSDLAIIQINRTRTILKRVNLWLLCENGLRTYIPRSENFWY